MAIEQGNTVSVHYTGKLEDGTVFDSSEGRDPLVFEVGSGQLIPGFDNGVVGMNEGDKTTLTIAPEEGYGVRDEERVLEITRDQLTGVDPEIGQVLGLTDDQGNPHQASVVGVSESHVKLDFNHFLAGKTLLFDIEIVNVSS